MATTENQSNEEFDSISPAEQQKRDIAAGRGKPTGKYEVIVKEKKGFFGSAIPLKLPCCVAILCCFLNCIVPGVGTLLSAPFSLCEKEREKGKARNFFVNLLAGLLQLITSVLLIGWLWSIMWAIEFLKPLKGEGFEES